MVNINTITEEEKQEILRLYIDEKLSQDRVAVELGLNRIKVHLIIKNAGVSRSRSEAISLGQHRARQERENPCST